MSGLEPKPTSSMSLEDGKTDSSDKSKESRRCPGSFFFHFFISSLFHSYRTAQYGYDAPNGNHDKYADSAPEDMVGALSYVRALA